MHKRSVLIIVETIVIIILVGYMQYQYTQERREADQMRDGLLSPSIYNGVLPPRTFLVTNFDPIEQNFREYIEKNNFKVSIYVRSLRNGDDFGIGHTEGFFPASLNKVPIAVLVLRGVETGKYSLNAKIPLVLNKEDELDPDYIGKKEQTVQVLIEKMLQQSDNTAFHSLLQIVDQRELGILFNYYDISLNGAYNPEAALHDQQFLGAKALARMLSTLYYSTILEPEHSEYILELLTKTSFDVRKFAGIPDDVRIAQKFGGYYDEKYRVFHTCGIMYLKETRTLYCILTRDLEVEEAEQVVGAFVRGVHDYLLDKEIAFEDIL